MMDLFIDFFQIGFRFPFFGSMIDHTLFLIVMVCAFQLGDVKRVLYWILIFGLTMMIGSSLMVFNILKVEPMYVQLLTLSTIIIVAIMNITLGKRTFKSKSIGFHLFISLFGIIHGLSFGSEIMIVFQEISNLWTPLISMSLGFLSALILAGVSVLLISQIAFQIIHFKHRDWIIVVSAVCLGVALEILRSLF